jgi:hypothetical protein
MLVRAFSLLRCHMSAARSRRRSWLLAPLAWLVATLFCAPLHAQGEPGDQLLDISTGLGSGVLRGGRGGLAMAQRAPVFADVTILTPHETILWIGGSLRVELEEGRAVAAVARAALRYKLSAFELRPGVALPFYFAPKTMLGPEANLGLRYPLGQDLGLLASAGLAAFMVGNDVPHGTTIIMFNAQLGVDLFL